MTAVPSSSSPRPLVTCDCRAFSFSASQVLNGDASNDDISCMHCRLVHEIILVYPFSGESTCTLPSYLDTKWVESGYIGIQREMVELRAKPGTQKWSILSQDLSCEIISTCSKPSSGRIVATCHNSFCSIKNGSGRLLENIDQKSSACLHLKTYSRCHEQLQAAGAYVDDPINDADENEQREGSTVCLLVNFV